MPAQHTTGTPSLRELLADLVDVEPTDDRPVTGLSVDSRKTHPGDLFLACAGQNTHGVQFAADAVRRGAVAAAVDREPGALTRDELESALKRLRGTAVPVVTVEGLARRAGRIAERFYGNPSRALTVVGVTGTNGKTSCTHLLAQALNEGNTCGVIGTLGAGFYGGLQAGQHTTPDAVELHASLAAMRDAGATHAAMEVSSHGLAQGRADGVAFDIAVFTNLSRDHLDYHADMEEYAAAKQRLFTMPDLRCAVINGDDPHGCRLVRSLPASVRSVTFSLADDRGACERGGAMDLGCVRGRRVLAGADGLQIQLQTPWGEGELRSPLLGRFNASNLLAVLGVLLFLGMPLREALRRLAGVRNAPGRMERYTAPGRPLVVVDYAHTPDALRHVLDALREHCTGELWCVLGCGGDRDRGKRPLMGAAAESLAEHVVLTDDNPRHENGDRIIEDIRSGMSDPVRALVLRERRKAIAEAVRSAQPTDIVLVAGKGHEAFQIVGDTRIPFDDGSVVRSLLEDRTP